LLFLLLAFDVRLKTVRYTVQSEKIGAPVRIALVTDLHSCSYGKGQRTLVDAIEKQKPDLLLLGGDIFDDGLPDRNTEIFLSAIADKYPCYYVTGNHEYWSLRVDEMLNTLRKYGVEILDGKTKTIEIKGQRMSLSGIDDPDAAYYSDAGEVLYTQLNEIQTERDSHLFSVLLAHRPSYIKLYRKYKFDLVLSGHAHGGQWRIPYLLNGVFAPDEGWFPKYAGGQYRFADGQMIVSRGLARESTRVPRIFNRPELVIVDLQPASPEGSAQ
jgi:phosphoesterase